MLLLIIFGLIFILGIVALILYSKTNKFYEDWCKILGFVAIIVGGLPLIVCSIIAIINAPNTVSYQTNEIALQNRIEYLNNTKKAILSYNENYITRLDINAYNNEVSELKSEIQNNKMRLNNPWLNTYTQSFWANYNPDCVSYISTF